MDHGSIFIPAEVKWGEVTSQAGMWVLRVILIWDPRMGYPGYHHSDPGHSGDFRCMGSNFDPIFSHDSDPKG